MAGMCAQPVESVSFDRAASYYDATRALPPEVAREQTQLLLDEIGSSARPVLEIGVGTGRIAAPLAGRHRVVGIDLSREMLRVLAAKDSGVAAVEGDAVRLPFRSEAFGAVVACHVLHLVRDWQRAVAEVGRVLVPGGVLLVSRGRTRAGLGCELEDRIRDVAGLTESYIGLDDPAELDGISTSWAGRCDMRRRSPALEPGRPRTSSTASRPAGPPGPGRCRRSSGSRRCARYGHGSPRSTATPPVPHCRRIRSAGTRTDGRRPVEDSESRR
jgi:SAM-dependent methyltransferase